MICIVNDVMAGRPQNSSCCFHFGARNFPDSNAYRYSTLSELVKGTKKGTI